MAKAVNPSDTPKRSDTAAVVDEQIVGKGHPTPKRKEREQANQRPLVPNDRKEAKARDREARAKAQERMMAGDERYLMARDKGAQRAFVRRYVDARTTLSEFLIPVMILILLVSLVQNPYVLVLSTLAMYAYVLIIAVELLVLGFQVKRRVDAKFGADKREKGLALYASMRAIQFRRFRAPRPSNARREFPE